MALGRDERLAPARILDADVGLERAGLVVVVGDAVHDAEGRVVDDFPPREGVLDLRRRRRVRLPQRRLILGEVRRRVAAVKPFLPVVVPRNGQPLRAGGLPVAFSRRIPDQVVVDGAAAVGIARERQLVDAPVAVRAVDPQPVAHQRSATGDVDVVELRDRDPARQSGRDRVGGVVALPPWPGIERLHIAAPAVAAALRHHVEVDAAGHDLRRDRRRLIVDLLEHALVVVEHRRAAACAGPVHRRAVDREILVVVARSVDAQRALLHRLRAADVVGVHLHARDDLGERPGIAPGRDAFENRLVHHRLLQRRLDIDGRRLAGHGDGFLQRTDLEPVVDRDREAGADGDVAPLDGPEALELEPEGVRARRQAIEPVRAVPVGDPGSRAADQSVAAERDRHARQHGAARVLNHAGDGSRCDLGEERRSRDEQTQRRNQHQGSEPHDSSRRVRRDGYVQVPHKHSFRYDTN